MLVGRGSRVRELLSHPVYSITNPKTGFEIPLMELRITTVPVIAHLHDNYGEAKCVALRFSMTTMGWGRFYSGYLIEEEKKKLESFEKRMQAISKILQEKNCVSVNL